MRSLSQPAAGAGQWREAIPPVAGALPLRFSKWIGRLPGTGLIDVLRAGVWCLLCLWPLPATLDDYGFRVRHAFLAFQQDAIALTAGIDYRFSDTLVEALERGVPLTLTVTTRIRQPRRGLWDETVWRRDLDFRIQYYPLSQVYRVVDETNRFQRSFPRLDSALVALGELNEIVFTMEEGWAPPRFSYGEVKVWLNIERLPWALRPIAYFSPDWRLSSNPYRWEIRR